jgi:Alpha/beta hydrolase domain
MLTLYSCSLRKCAFLAAAATAALIVASGAQARLVKINAGPPTEINLPAFGATGPYLKISGTFEGELDPTDRRNELIADIALAPRANGKVRYTSTFMILRPADLGKGNRKIFYDFANRGNKRILQWLNDGIPSNDPTGAADFGNGFLMRHGYAVAWSGWGGDVRAGRNAMSIELPVATNPDGGSITGLVLSELIPAAPDRTSVALPYAASTTSAANGTLTVRQHERDARVAVEGWTWLDPQHIEFPGPAHVQWIYEFVYEAKDPKVMGIGHAATRDFLSFLKYADKDDSGNPNPLAVAQPLRGAQGRAQNVEAIYSWGRSQGGRVQRDFLRYGFNEDESGRSVFDGMIPYATGSGGNMWMNFRFSQPTVSAQQHSRRFSHEPELPHTMAVVHDPLTGASEGILKRCLYTQTCPKVFNVESENEYWNKSSSLNHTDAFGQDLAIDDLSPNARQYFIASIQHNTEFNFAAKPLRFCQQPGNPLYNGPVFRALAVALDEWVGFGVEPPKSAVPLARNGTLVPPQALRFPRIPAHAYAGWPAVPALELSPNGMNVNVLMDFSKVPPRPKGPVYTTLVPQVDQDGNDIAGIRLPFLQAPLGTFTGWGRLKPEFGGADPDVCGQLGQFIAFANTKAERLAAGDPRLSIEERYPARADYVEAVKAAAASLVRERFLLVEDYDRIVQAAVAKGTDLWKVPSQDPKSPTQGEED